MSVSRVPPLNISAARLKQQQSFEKPPDGLLSGGSSGNLSPNLQPPTPPVFPNNKEPFAASSVGGRYILLEQLEGSALYRSINLETREEYACKIVPKDKYRESLAGHLRLDSHPHVNQVEEVLIGESRTYIFYPRSYGDLHSYVRSRRRLPESEALRLFKQVTSAVAACHEAGIVLRDLKLRKFVFKNPERSFLKLETLDDAVILEDDTSDMLSDKHGCPAYVSPEILTTVGQYSGKAADCWSLGVMLYTMLVGRYPFHDNDPGTLFGKIRRGLFSVPDSLSSRAKCLIRSLLRRDPVERLTSDEVLDHQWFHQERHGSNTSHDGHSHGLHGDDAKVPDQTVPDLAVPDENPSLFT